MNQPVAQEGAQAEGCRQDPVITRGEAALPTVVGMQPRGPVRLLAAAVFLLSLVAIAALRAVLWDAPREPTTLVERGLALLSVTWALPVIPVILMVVGYALVRRRDHVLVSVPTEYAGPLVSYRVVTRGENVAAVLGTIRSIRAAMHEISLFAYVIEVATDRALPIGPAPDLVQLVVPHSYQAPGGALYKARALAYALEHSALEDGDWVLHLDEESHITPSLVAGVSQAICEEDQSAVPRVGQGLILYSRSLRGNRFFALADSIRSGDDLGRFHAQAQLGVSLVGLHGSFVLVRTDIERRIGFEFGPRGSITEDAWWALLAMDQGIRLRWVDGVIVEQSPQTVGDFLRQRRRWFVGLAQVARHAPARLRWRAPLIVSVTLWSLAWLSLLWTILNLFLGLRTPPGVTLLGTVVLGAYVAQYVVGLYLNLAALPSSQRPGVMTRVGLYVAQVALIPVFSLLEACAVLWGVVRPNLGFHVIRKE